MAYPLGGDQFAALLQNWKHPVFRPFLATAVTSIVSVIFYEKGLPTTEDIKKINNVIVRIAAPNFILNAYRPQDDVAKAITPSPNHPVLKIFGLEPELVCAANYTNSGKSQPYTSGALLDFLREQISISYKNGAFVVLLVALASIAGLVLLYINRRNSKRFQAQNLSDTQLIAYLMQQIDRFREAREVMKDIGVALQLAEEEAYVAKSDLRKSIEEKNCLEKQVIELTSQREEASTTANRLDEALKVARDTIEEKVSLVASTTKRLETQNERIKELESRTLQLEHLLDEERLKSSELQTEGDHLERAAEKQLEAIHLERYELALQLQAAKSKIEELAQQNTELDATLRTPGLRDAMMREFFGKSETQIHALELQVRDLTLQNDNLAEELHSPRNADGTKTPRRKLRQAIFTNYQAKASLLDYPDDGKVYELQLPCHDPRYHGGQIPLPAQVLLEKTIVDGEPVETLNMDVDGKEMPFDKCRNCREWYGRKDRNDHQLVCRDFFTSAVFCPHCGKIFRNNGGFLHKHLPGCERQTRGALV
ncbi:hypothetical protein HRS9139_06128 [Pyrenophora teres f. teres]|uniref:SCP-1 multi-domain protein n=1 Tax=Pyrenophora teres f. teres TaxID=97479 RepID=A0A6S6WD09_9PLEO|nr:hypothetical protein HRS9139_06128 [Pyrenophora teres f. teres]CAE7207028.1 SCP-1 multi-domain protein [Pyrenophora teres f. teres]